MEVSTLVKEAILVIELLVHVVSFLIVRNCLGHVLVWLGRVKSLVGGELDGGAAVTLASQSSSIVFTDYTPGESVLLGSTISLTATATGLNNVDVSATIEWKDDQGTIIGSGPVITLLASNIGTLSILAEATDLDGSLIQRTAYFR